MNQTQKIGTVQRWMAHFGLTFDDLGFDPEFTCLDDLDHDQLDELLMEAEEDRARQLTKGVWIEEDYE